MKITRNSLVFSGALLLATCGSRGQERDTAKYEIQLAGPYTDLLWGQNTLFSAQWDFHPGEPYAAYRTPLPEGKTMIECKSSGGVSRVVFQPAGLPPPPGTAPLPYRSSAQWLSGLALDVGEWDCQLTQSVIFVDHQGRDKLAVLRSNPVNLSVKRPNSEDEAVIRETGLWDLYHKQSGLVDQKGMPQVLIRIDEHFAWAHATVNAHPASHYYCRYWSRELHALDPYKSDRYLSADLSNATPLWGPWYEPLKFDEPLRNLEKNRCIDATAADLAFWRSVVEIDFGHFANAQQSAKEGLKHKPDSGQKAYFEKLLRFQSEADYLRQFKHVKRLGTDGLWRE